MPEQSTTIDTTSDGLKATEPSEVIRFWLNEIGAAKKREKTFRKDGQRILDIYEGKNPDQVPFNICYSNTETLLPALYSAIPRPVVQRRFKDADPLGKSAATAGQRVLEFLLDTNVEGYETFDSGVRSATLDALLPGRGVTNVKYDAEIGELGIQAEANSGAAADAPASPAPYKASELVCIETRSWNRVYFGYAKKWSKVPWVAYEEDIDREEAVRLFGEEMVAKLTFTENEREDNSEGERKRGTEEERNKGERKTCTIYQIWDKDGDGKPGSQKKIRYVSVQYGDDYLKVEDDPLQLTGFFNCPKPLCFLEKSNDLLPVALYVLYENQAKELNEITRRISRIATAIKARFIFDASMGDDLKSLFDADDNEGVPADKSASLAAEKGLQNAIWFAPIDVLIATLQQLYVARENCKRVIYEITGISDIIRGSTVASETATAQELKSQWGTLRLKRLQKEVQRYARDLLRMMLELAATKFSEETWAKMTGLPFLLEPQFNELQAVSQALTQKVQQQVMAFQQQVASQPPQPGAAPPQPPPPTQEMQQLQQVEQQLKAPKWSDVLALLRDDTQRSYRVDIETNSTIEPEAAEDQKNISELLNALAQYLNGVGPLVAKGVMPFEAAQAMMLAITRRFRFGTEIEDSIKQMKPPPPEDDGKAAEAAKLAAEQKQHQDEMMQTGIIEKAKDAREREAEKNRAAAETMKISEEAAKRQSDETIRLAEIAAETQREATRLDSERRTKQMEINAKREADREQSVRDQDTELKKTAMQVAGQIEIAGINAQQKDKAAQGDQEVQLEAVAQEKDKAAKGDDVMKRILETQNRILAVIAAPTKAKRGKDGKIDTVEKVFD